MHLLGAYRHLSLPISRPEKKPRLGRLSPTRAQTISLRSTLSKGFLITIGVLSFLATFLYLVILKGLPSPQELNHRNQIVTTKIFDRNGQLLYKIYKNENRSLIDRENIPSNLINATIAIEDQDFYLHTGVSLKGIFRAFTRNIFDQKSQGGSTITQQLVKNTLLTSEKTVIRKIKEVILAIGVELTFTKNQILSMYFNQVGYGGAVYGVEEASLYYFGISAKDLNLAQSALLAGLPASPTLYSPFGANPELAVFRQHEVLRRMVEEGYITQEEADTAKREKLKFIKPKNNIIAPHFVMYTKNVLVAKFGEETVNHGGLNVTTTLDVSIQKIAEDIVSEELAKLIRLHVTNAAVLVTNPKTGEILAMVGSADYFDIDHDGQVNVVTRPRQPGSSIKPLTYSLAFETAFKPSGVIDDSPITYRTPGSPPYQPVNYDGRFHGKITLRQALANSYNVPAVKLLSQLGVNNLLEIAKKFGITTWNEPSRYGLSLTLGGGDVTMIDLATAYGVFANLGHRVNLHPISEVTNYKQASLFVDPCFPAGCLSDPVIKPITAFYISDILSDPKARANTFGFNSQLNITGHQVAVKTGTTNNLRDNWAIGYTDHLLVAVWVGNNDNTPMSGIASGITGATPIWHRLMTKLLENQPSQQFPPLENLLKVTVCPLTQTKTCPECPNSTIEYFVKGEEPTKTCTKEQIDRLLNPPTDTLPRNQILDGSSTAL
ncbi:hypothetical protein A3B57_03390 [Microgenomates group bacterium RIFCSPLOWO2_01_FULL_47_10]|nr:MAG: hypothetical protein A3B57_03390 [Microgenomates group bacterium RIFCSPLOWO2_01_FULL_47_10]